MIDHEVAPVSVLIPCYRCGETIERAVASVASQTLAASEVFLVDDCSDDDTLAVLHEVQTRYPDGWIHVIEQPENRGPGEARNVGWDRATQSYVAFLDADDSWHPQKIEIQYMWMRNHPEVVLTGHATRRMQGQEDLDDTAFSTPESVEFYPVAFKRLLWSNLFPTRSVMVHRNRPDRFVPRKYHSEDYLLWLRIACSGGMMARCEEPLAWHYKRHYAEVGLSSQIWPMEKGEIDTYFRVFKGGCLGAGMLGILLFKSLTLFGKRLIVANLFGSRA